MSDNQERLAKAAHHGYHSATKDWVQIPSWNAENCLKAGWSAAAAAVLKEHQRQQAEIKENDKMEERSEVYNDDMYRTENRTIYTPIALDPDESELAAEALWIDLELRVRGDGMWKPWADLGDEKREDFRHMVNVVVREINRDRMHKANTVRT